MLLWMVLTAMCSAAAVAAAVPLIRRYEQSADRARMDLRIYDDQLHEVERDRAAGNIAAPEAEAARLEIQRRMLAATRQREAVKAVSPAWRVVAIFGVTALVVLGAINLYALEGRPDLASGAAGAVSTVASLPAPNSAGGTGSVDEMIASLETRLRQNPGDADGWRMLGWSYFNTQRYDRSADAYAKALALAPGNDDYRSSYAEALVQAAGGSVIPAAKSLFEETLRHDPKEPRARFYLALAREQAGDQGGALDLWVALLADAPADAGWTDDVRQHIANLGKATGRDVTAILAAGPAPQASPAVQPDAAAIQAMPAQDQQAMINGMVEGLAQRLAQSPHDAQGWIKLMRARQVLSQPDLAREALKKASAEFAADPAALADIETAARSLGVAAQ